MINVTFSVDLSALERSVAKGASCGESQAASHIVLLLLWLFKAIESALWPSSAFNEGFLRPAHHQPRGRRGSRGAIALQILAGIEAKPSPLNDLEYYPSRFSKTSYGLNHAPNVTDCTMTFYVISAKETRDLPNARSHWCVCGTVNILDSKILPTFSFGSFDSFLAGLVRADIGCMLHLLCPNGP